VPVFISGRMTFDAQGDLFDDIFAPSNQIAATSLGL
jgi:hypothetical protein